MNEYDIKRLAEIYAIQAEIEGMKIENLIRINAELAPAYGNEAFQQVAENLRIVASKNN